MWAKIGMAIKNFAKGKAVEKASQMASNDDGNRMSRIVVLAIPVFGILLLFIAPLIIIAQSFGNIWVIQSVDPHVNRSLSGQGMPSDDTLYPLDGKGLNNEKLDFLEIDGKWLSDSEFDEMNDFILNSVDNAGNDWGTKVATAGWALVYATAQKGVKLHYGKCGATGYCAQNAVDCKPYGYCKNWGRIQSSNYDYQCGYTGYINRQGDCNGGNQKYYVGLPCNLFVKWAINTGCGTTFGDLLYSHAGTTTDNFDEGQPGDVVVRHTSHIQLFLKKNDDGTFMIAESTTGAGLNATVIRKYTEKSLKNGGYVLYKLSDVYNDKCKTRA